MLKFNVPNVINVVYPLKRAWVIATTFSKFIIRTDGGIREIAKKGYVINAEKLYLLKLDRRKYIDDDGNFTNKENAARQPRQHPDYYAVTIYSNGIYNESSPHLSGNQNYTERVALYIAAGIPREKNFIFVDMKNRKTKIIIFDNVYSYALSSQDGSTFLLHGYNGKDSEILVIDNPFLD